MRERHLTMAAIGVLLTALWILLLITSEPGWLRAVQAVMLMVSIVATGYNIREVVRR